MTERTQRSPSLLAPDAASLTRLLGDYGALWDITRTPSGFAARRRPRPEPSAILTAATVPALRELLQHGYDTGKLAGILRDFGAGFEIERLDPGSHWIAVPRNQGSTEVITAADLDNLRGQLSAHVA